MPDHPDFTTETAERLASSLSSLGEGAVTYPVAAGFLFAVANAPDPLPAGEWLPALFDGKVPPFSGPQEAREVETALRSLEALIVQEAGSGEPRLPPGVDPFPDPLANLAPEAPLSAWSRGFSEGHEWLAEMWENLLPEDYDEDLGGVLTVLTFFSSREVAESFADDLKPPDRPFADFTREILKSLPRAMAAYAELGRGLEGPEGG